MSVAVDRVVEKLRDHGQKVVKAPGADRAQCPAHGGNGTNRAIRPGDQGALLKCFSHECVPAAIVAALGLTLADLFDNRREAVYDYGNGHMVHRRYKPDGKKDIWQESKPPATSLYRHPDSAPLEDADRVLVVEGEKCVDAALRLGAPAVTCWPGGAHGVAFVDLRPLAGKAVVLIPDNDAAGRTAMANLRDRLQGIAESVETWEVPAEFGDIADLYTAGGSKEQLGKVELEVEHEVEVEVDEDPEFDADVAAEARRIRIREEARRRVAATRAAPMPPATPLGDFLAIVDPDTEYRVEGLLPIGGNVVLAAQYKTGKSTAVANLLRSLADGVDFLGKFPTRQAGRVVLIDDELDPRTLRRWLGHQGIQNTDRIMVVSLRGRTSAFDLLDPKVRAEWVRILGPGDVVILDCLRPVLDSLTLSEDKDAGRFLVAFDALKAEAGYSESLIVHHMGHTGERSRGDSRILDWPDATWKIVREDDNTDSPRYFSAFGRDVDVREGHLEYEPLLHTLTYQGGSRRDETSLRAREVVLAYVRENPGCSGEGIRADVRGYPYATIIGARRALVDEGLIEQRKRAGKGSGFAYFPVTPSSPSNPFPEGPLTPSSPYVEGEEVRGGSNTQPLPAETFPERFTFGGEDE